MGITIFELLSFIKQGGLALAGASSLWGVYFYWKKYNSSGEKSDVFSSVSQKMLEPLTVSIFATIIGWFGLSFVTEYSAFAHEGITIDPTRELVKKGLEITEPFFFALLTVFIIGMLYRRFNKEGFKQNGYIFYGLTLALSTILISLPVWLGRVDGSKLFFIGHNFHSILTLGTVLVLDFLLLVTKYHETFERHIYPVLPMVSKVIWFGLAIDFASVYFIFEEAISYTSKFLFMQTVIGIIIINGIILSGPITRKMIASIKENSIEPLPKKWNTAAAISGSVSIASWLTITFTDFIKNVTLSYPMLLALYIGFVAIAYLTYEVLEHYKVGSRW